MLSKKPIFFRTYAYLNFCLSLNNIHPRIFQSLRNSQYGTEASNISKDFFNQIMENTQHVISY